MFLADAIIEINISKPNAGKAAARKLIQCGKISVNGEVILDPQTKLLPGRHLISKSGRRPESKEIDIP